MTQAEHTWLGRAVFVAIAGAAHCLAAAALPSGGALAPRPTSASLVEFLTLPPRPVTVEPVPRAPTPRTSVPPQARRPTKRRAIATRQARSVPASTGAKALPATNRDPSPPPAGSPPASVAVTPIDLASTGFVLSHGTVGASDSSRGRATGAGSDAEVPRSAAVALDRSSWRCSWPETTTTSRLRRGHAVLRALVDASGHPLSIKLVSASADAFGRAAMACARRHRFIPGRNAQGRERRAMSPPIHVAFRRQSP